MSTTPPITAWVPKVSGEPTPAEVHRHLTLLFQKLTNHTTAFGLLAHKIDAIKSGNTTTVEEGGGGGGGSIVPFTPTAGIPVNDQSGVVSYSTVAGDDGALIIFSDASPVSVSVPPQSPPFSFFATNLGAGTVTFTPTSGTINGGATFALPQDYSTLIAFDSVNWWATVSPVFVIPNFVDSEVVAGSGTAWTLAHTPAAGCIPQLYLIFPSFGGVYVPIGTPPSGPSASIAGTAITLAGLTFTPVVGSLYATYRF